GCVVVCNKYGGHGVVLVVRILGGLEDAAGSSTLTRQWVFPSRVVPALKSPPALCTAAAMAPRPSPPDSAEVLAGSCRWVGASGLVMVHHSRSPVYSHCRLAVPLPCFRAFVNASCTICSSS